MALLPVSYVGEEFDWEEVTSHYATLEGFNKWEEVKYRWIGDRGKWYLASFEVNQPLVPPQYIENMRYWDGNPHRGDMAIYGSNIHTTPQVQVPGFLGSLYKLGQNMSDTTENFVSFLERGDLPIDEQEIGITYSALRADGSNYIETVSAPGSEGFNWGCGNFSGTVIQSLLPNWWSILFRLKGVPVGQNGVWLIFSGSQRSTTLDFSYWGVFIDDTLQGRYIREREGSVQVSDPFTVRLDEWMQVEVSTTSSNHTSTMTFNRGQSDEVVSTLGALFMIQEEFDHVSIGAGPLLNTTTYAIDDYYGRTTLSDLDVRRFYTETAEEYDPEVSNFYWVQPFMGVIFSKDTPDGPETDGSDWVIALGDAPEDPDIIQVPPFPAEEAGQYFIRLETPLGPTNRVPFKVTANAGRQTYFHTDFTDFAAMKRDLILSHKQWGGANGGIVKENVELYPNYKDPANNINGMIRCYVNGDYYNGPIQGVDNVGNTVEGRYSEVGACIVTREYFGPGSYRIKARINKQDGHAFSLWTFHYEEIYPNDSRYEDVKLDGDFGLRESGNEEDGFFIVRNHEIDIEIPTSLDGAPNMEIVDFTNARLNTWQGELRNFDVPEEHPDYWTEYQDTFTAFHHQPINDGEFHEFRFDWHTDDPNPPDDPNNPGTPLPATRVDFFTDGVYWNTNTENIPDIVGRFWMGSWCPRGQGGNRWAGPHCSFIRDSTDIASFEFIPFPTEPSRAVMETYPGDGWRGIGPDNLDSSVVDTLPPFIELQAPFDDDIPKEANDHWTDVQLLGGNPPEYNPPYRLMWRNDIPGHTPGQAGEFKIQTLQTGLTVRARVTFQKIGIASAGLELLSFEAGNDILDMPAVLGVTYDFTFPVANAGVVIRRHASGRNFVGTIELRIDYI